MDIVEKNCLTLLEKCMEKKMSTDTIQQIMFLTNLQKEKALKIIQELTKIVEKSTERELREAMSELIVK